MIGGEITDNEIAISKRGGDAHVQVWRIIVPLLVAAVVYTGLSRLPFLINVDYVEPQVRLIRLGLFDQEMTWEKTRTEIQSFEAENFKASIVLYGKWIGDVLAICCKIIAGITFFLLAYFFSWRPNNLPDQSEWSAPRAFFYTGVFFFLLFAGSNCLQNWLGEGYSSISQIKTWQYCKLGICLHFFSSVIFAPLIEEFYFRWGGQRMLLALGLSRWGAVSCQAIVFGAVHYTSHSMIGMCVAAAMGVFFGIIYLKTQNIWIPIVLHAVVNAMVMGSVLWG